MNSKLILSALAASAAFILAPSAHAADVCRGPALSAGQAVHGPILEVADASSLCVATGASPSSWVRIPVSNLGATRAELMAAAFGKNATCSIGRDGQGECVVEGASLAKTLQRPQIIKAATEWR